MVSDLDEVEFCYVRERLVYIVFGGAGDSYRRVGGVIGCRQVRIQETCEVRLSIAYRRGLLESD
jgi:hypothetical protein